MSSVFTCQAILQGSSGLPSDEFVNTFHMATPGLTGDSVASQAKSCADKVASFYSGTDHNLDAGLAALINRTANIKVYGVEPIAAKTTRPILYQGTWVLRGPNSPEDLPTEVALALSYFTDRNLPGHRGRVYIGPFNHSILEDVSDGPRPTAAFLTQMASAASGMLLPATAGSVVTTPTTDFAGTVPSGESVFWCLRSTGVKKAGPIAFTGITAGWIDNEWDTVRRRRLPASARTRFVTTPPDAGGVTSADFPVSGGI